MELKNANPNGCNVCNKQSTLDVFIFSKNTENWVNKGLQSLS